MTQGTKTKAAHKHEWTSTTCPCGAIALNYVGLLEAQRDELLAACEAVKTWWYEPRVVPWASAIRQVTAAISRVRGEA